jgi:acetate kinase
MNPSNKHILTVNGGSSSIKFALFETGNSLDLVLAGGIERIGSSNTVLKVKVVNPVDSFSRPVVAPDHSTAVEALVAWMKERRITDALCAIGHRVLQGGPKYYKPQRITSDMVAEMRRLSPFDPDHIPEELELIEAFHHDLPRVAQLIAIPRRYEAKGIRRYGFHGLSYSYLVEELGRVAGAEVANGRVILAHLGNGASLAAVMNGRSFDTSMGFTPASGVPMGTRSGDLDPGLAAYLSATENMTPKEFNKMVNSQSGLLGISETSSDMRDLLEHEAQDVRAAEAVALFCYQVKKWIGAFAAALGGVDTLVFAGGVGENAPLVRTRICEVLEFLGIELDGKANDANESVISTAASRAVVRVIHTNEELMIAKTVSQLLAREQNKEK